MSEKLFSGAKAGAVPIYWGNARVGEDINLERIISLHEFKDIDAAISEILELEKDTERLERMVALPIMTPRQLEIIEESRRAIVELFLHASESARRSELHRPIGTTTYAREYVLVSALRREEWVLKRKATISRILRKFGLLDLFLRLSRSSGFTNVGPQIGSEIKHSSWFSKGKTLVATIVCHGHLLLRHRWDPLYPRARRLHSCYALRRQNKASK